MSFTKVELFHPFYLNCSPVLLRFPDKHISIPFPCPPLAQPPSLHDPAVELYQLALLWSHAQFEQLAHNPAAYDDDETV